MYGGKNENNLLKCTNQSENDIRANGTHNLLFCHVWRWMIAKQYFSVNCIPKQNNPPALCT